MPPHVPQAPRKEPTTDVRNSVGNVLRNGDTVTVVRGIRLVDGDHDIDCRIPGIG